jgi:hypothetical protein
MKKDLQVYRGVRISKRWVATSEKGLSVAVSPEQVRKMGSVTQVIRYRNDSVVTRITEELKVTRKIAKKLFTDLKRFLWLAAVSKEKHLVPSPVLDDAWHSFVLFTKDYEDFCNKYFGGFLHHAPQRHGEKRLARADLRGTIEAMYKEFKKIPSPNWHYLPTSQILQT